MPAKPSTKQQISAYLESELIERLDVLVTRMNKSGPTKTTRNLLLGHLLDTHLPELEAKHLAG